MSQSTSWYSGGIVIAPHSHRSVCWATNVALVGAAIGTGWWLGWASATALGIGILAWQTIEVRRTGRSTGHRVAKLRAVDVSTGMPGTVRAHLARRCITADLRRGRDPLRLLPRAIPGPVPPPPPPPTPVRSGVFTLLADDGSRTAILSPTLVGRLASDPSGRYAVARIPDVSKTLSRNHALLEPTPTGLRVTDVGSGNGSAVAEATGLTWIGKYRTVTVGHGARLLLGTRYFEVTHE